MEGRIDEDDGAAVFYEASDFFARAAAKSDDATHRRIFERAAYTLFQKELEAFALRVSDP
ncbi:MAG: hypothetical protein HYW26_00235 [Candidatus Aenigmarchaeota archaeon]|nr:hypothetical protein [Candidatus Aenigmarchaeota archaeon]